MLTMLSTKVPNVVSHWRIIDVPNPYGDVQKTQRISVIYTNGTERRIPGSFRDRASVVAYVGRFLPGLVGKERTTDS